MAEQPWDLRRVLDEIKDDPKNYRLYIDLADCYVKMGKKQNALDVLGIYQRQGIRNQAINDYADQIKAI